MEVTRGAFIAAIIAIPIGAAIIGWVYLAQYRKRTISKLLFVAVHFLSVSAIICCYAYLCYDLYVPTVWQYLGWILFGIGSAVFWYAAFIHKASLTPIEDYNVFLSGPYKYIRHPIYSSGLLAAAGLILIAPAWEVVFTWVILFVSLWLLLLVEERELIARYGEEYKQYCARTKRVIPGVL